MNYTDIEVKAVAALDAERQACLETLMEARMEGFEKNVVAVRYGAGQPYTMPVANISSHVLENELKNLLVNMRWRSNKSITSLHEHRVEAGLIIEELMRREQSKG